MTHFNAKTITATIIALAFEMGHSLFSGICVLGITTVSFTCAHAVASSTPNTCHWVVDSSRLQEAIDHAASGDTLCLHEKTYQGPLHITRPLTLWGPKNAVIRAQQAGTTIRIEGHRVELIGMTIDGSGHRYDRLDGAVSLTGSDHRVQGIHVKNAVYGILLERTERALIQNNTIYGDSKELLGLRGDALRLWETYDALIEHNTVHNGRDVVIWYSSRNRIRQNHIIGGRYGTHFMYSHNNVVEHNSYERTVVGIFIMYSRNIHLDDNRVSEVSGAAGMGLGLKDSGNIRADRNIFTKATTGIYIDNSPSRLSDHNLFHNNTLVNCETAVTIHGQGDGNAFTGNGFFDNTHQVLIDGGNSASVRWSKNTFDDYQGYDLDNDGYGDVPYELRSFSDELTTRFAALRFFQGSPALYMIDMVNHLVPLFQPQTVVFDKTPRMPNAHNYAH